MVAYRHYKTGGSNMQKPTIVITGNPPWRETVSEQLDTDFTVNHQPVFGNYITTLIESLAALVIVTEDS